MKSKQEELQKLTRSLSLLRENNKTEEVSISSTPMSPTFTDKAATYASMHTVAKSENTQLIPTQQTGEAMENQAAAGGAASDNYAARLENADKIGLNLYKMINQGLEQEKQYMYKKLFSKGLDSITETEVENFLQDKTYKRSDLIPLGQADNPNRFDAKNKLHLLQQYVQDSYIYDKKPHGNKNLNGVRATVLHEAVYTNDVNLLEKMNHFNPNFFNALCDYKHPKLQGNARALGLSIYLDEKRPDAGAAQPGAGAVQRFLLEKASEPQKIQERQAIAKVTTRWNPYNIENEFLGSFRTRITRVKKDDSHKTNDSQTSIGGREV